MCKKSYSKSWQTIFSLKISKIAMYNCLLLFQLIYQLQTLTYSSGVPWIISSAFTKQRYKIYNSPDTFYGNFLVQKTHTNGSSATSPSKCSLGCFTNKKHTAPVLHTHFMTISKMSILFSVKNGLALHFSLQSSAVSGEENNPAEIQLFSFS